MVSGPLAPSEPVIVRRSNTDWLPVLWFGTLLLVCYAPILYRMVSQWANDEDMGHGFFVPIIAGFVAWQRRDKLRTVPLQSNPWGLALVIFAALQALAATLGAELFTARLAFVISLFGVIPLYRRHALGQGSALPVTAAPFHDPDPADHLCPTNVEFADAGQPTCGR